MGRTQCSFHALNRTPVTKVAFHFCVQELGRALHMALYVWEPDGILTNACDNDIQSLCLEDRPNMARTPGAVNTCLKEIVSSKGG
jgi:hypothetical protein